MKTVMEPVMKIEELAKKEPLLLSGAMVKDSGHCKYCIRGNDYCN